MFGYEEITLNLAYSTLYFLIALILLSAYSIYVYHFTVPQVSTPKKIFLVALRALALLITVLILFEPILSLSKKLLLEPLNYIYIDNSRSMQVEDGTNRSETISKITEQIIDNEDIGNIEYCIFGNEPRTIEEDSLPKIDFSDGVTNISELLHPDNFKDKNVSSVTIISDGVYTDGSNPVYSAENPGIPVFTIGIGDTTRRNDLEIKKVLFNDVLYSGTQTNVIATVQNKGFEGQTVTASLYEDELLVDQKIITLNRNGIQNVNFLYSPKESGEKKMATTISGLKGEFTNANNKKVFYINVLSNKIKILLLAGSPSSDLSFIRNALQTDGNLSANSLTQIGLNEFLEDSDFSIIDSADIFFLIGFPSRETPNELLSLIGNRIQEKKIPFFISVSPKVDLPRLLSLQSELPININRVFPGSREVQPKISINEINNPLLKSSNQDIVSTWENLPPILQPSSNFIPKPESRVLANIKLDNKVLNSPLILTRNLSNRRSVAVLAGDIWRWKLQTAYRDVNIFDNFILNCVKWLNTTDEEKRVTIQSSKRNYSLGETVEFSARVLDESLNPVTDAKITVEISSDENNYTIELQNVGLGLFDGSMQINETGDFVITGKAEQNGKMLGTDGSTFNMGELEIEMVNPVMNYSMLYLLANESGGEYFEPDEVEEWLEKLIEINRVSSKEKIITSEVSLWSDEIMLIIVIVLFGLEWFIRKRSGML